ncbi:hypothetical protein [Streptomyces specialis]|uniref:hypothetical protein n=1 Tax=Streptomyces specialis TaxID=498367 RepID=UPI00131B2B61|nr:hypothetical protein [Streptomyces specialis]
MRSAAAVGLVSALTVVTAGLTASCDLARAVDCARLALEVTNAADDLGNAIATGDVAAFDAAADSLSANVDEVRGDVDDSDVDAAADSVQQALDSIESGFRNGTEVDVSPLFDATGQLTDACSE